MAVVTLADVAALAGVGHGTVSRALGGRRNVSAGTRDKVLRAAAELGYRPNAAAAVLGAKARGRRSRLAVAWLSVGGHEEAEFLAACEGVGVEGEWFDPRRFGSVAEMLQVLWGRGFDGLLVNFERWPWTEAETASAPGWEQFSVVKFKRMFPSMRFHLVRLSPFDYMRLALSKVRESGAEKLAVLLQNPPSIQDNEARLGAVMVAREQWAAEGRELVWRLWDAPANVAPPDVPEWLRNERPQVILGFVWPVARALMEAGWRFPEDAGFAAVIGPKPGETDPQIRRISGCSPNYDEIHRRAMRQLREMLGRGERGMPSEPSEQVIEPDWLPGETLEKRRLPMS